MKKEYVIPVFVPHLGCPNDCVFCNQKSISGQKKNITKEDARKTIDYFLENIKDKEGEKEIAFFGGSFTGIDEKQQEELLQIAYGYTKNKEDSIDIMQNAYVALLESNKKFESNEHIKYFLIRVTINESINFVKSHNKKRVVYDNDIVMNAPDQTKFEMPYDISKIVTLLSEKYKTIIILYYYDEMKIKDISRVLKISESAVKKRLERARNLIREIIERNYKND